MTSPLLLPPLVPTTAMISPRIRSLQRIGPHNKLISDLIIGSLLGDGYLERHGNGYRLCIQQENSNKEYLYWLHSLFANSGYCDFNKPLIQSRIGNKGVLRYVLLFKTWTYSSFYYFHNDFYYNGRKIVPSNLSSSSSFSPLALAIWIMGNGSRAGQGLKLSTNSFTYKECEELSNILINSYGLIISIHKTGTYNQYNLYIHKISLPVLWSITKQFIHPSLKFKFAVTAPGVK